ncbi:hypothetical protein ACHAW5_001871 [Stephanodiscus triporus]|uniref:Uncharacterized protein n=1 Tax=Stephanodiscus triporus TaxID=2934178 RepID=A0ABD3NYW2_9STRA
MWPNVLILLLLSSTIRAFLPSAELRVTARTSSRRKIAVDRTTSKLDGGLFGLEGKCDENGEGKSRSSSSSSSSSQSEIISSAPTSRVMEIPVASIKRGGLRFALGLHLVGLQDKGTWRPNQADENALDMHFKDGTAMFKLILDDDAIRVIRYGVRPSLAYLLQESVALHGILDELSTLCSDAGIESGNRLLLLEEPGDAIDRARATLPARKA